MKRFAVLALVFSLGFLSSLEASSRAWLPRIPQPDDVTICISSYSLDDLPRVPSPLGGTTSVCSVSFWPSDTSPCSTRMTVDGFTCSDRTIYTYDARTRLWSAWTPMTLYYLGGAK